MYLITGWLRFNFKTQDFVTRLKIKAQIKKKNGNENLEKREVRLHNKLFAENKVRFTRAEQPYQRTF